MIMCGDLQGERPVRTRECADHVRATGGENIVDGVDRSDDAFAARDGSTACEPADNITCFLIVEVLM